MNLELLPGDYAVWRLAPGSPIPVVPRAPGEVVAVTASDDEISVMGPGRLAPQKVPAEHVLTFVNLQLLLRTLTPARWTLLERLRADGPLTVNELARRLGRDYKNVHGDVKRLAELSLIERRKDALVSVAWDVVRAEMRLAA